MLGNDQAGVAVYSPGTQCRPGNVISANLIGVLISGADGHRGTVTGNLIGTDSTARPTWATPRQGVLIESPAGVAVQGERPGRR